MRLITHWIDGKPTEGDSTRTSPVYNPALGSQEAEVLFAESSDVDRAVQAAARAFEDWSESSLSHRSQVLFAFRELLNDRKRELAELITDEHGKVVSDAEGEVQRGLEVVEFACGIPSLLKGDYSDQVASNVDSFSFRQPLGVVAGITPFNFPAMVAMWMYPVAIAAGNCFVLKPSERDPSAALFVAELWSEAGLPDAVFNVVQGDKAAVDALLDHPGVAAISFVRLDSDRSIHSRASNGQRKARTSFGRGEESRHRVARRRSRVRLQSPHRCRIRFSGGAVYGHLGRDNGGECGRPADGSTRSQVARSACRLRPGSIFGHGTRHHSPGT